METFIDSDLTERLDALSKWFDEADREEEITIDGYELKVHFQLARWLSDNKISIELSYENYRAHFDFFDGKGKFFSSFERGGVSPDDILESAIHNAMDRFRKITA